MSFLGPILSWLKGKEVAALSFAQDGEDWATHGICMALENDQIKIRSDQHLVSHSQVEAWLASVRPLPLVIGISSDEILTRKVEVSDLPKAELLKIIIPQARPEEFFIQQMVGQSGTFAAIIRNNRLKQILEIIPDENQVVSLYLTPLAFTTLARGLKASPVRIGEYQLILDGSDVVQIDHQEAASEPLVLSEEESLEQPYALSYSAGLNYLTQSALPSDFDVKKASEEYIHKRFLSQFGTYILAAVFLIFLINIFLYFQFSQENEQLVGENSSLLATQKQVAEMESFLTAYEDLLNTGQESVFTRFSDELGYTVPEDIQLLRLEIRPLYLEEKKAVEQHPSVWIEGTSQNAVAYADWIDQIKGLDWVRGIEENSYRKGKFQLKITIKNDA